MNDPGSPSGDPDAFLSPRAPDPFAVPDPLSDSDDETPQSTIGRADQRNRTKARRPDDAEESSHRGSPTYRDADSFSDSRSGTIRKAVPEEEDDDDEPPQSLLYESTTSGRRTSPNKPAQHGIYQESSPRAPGSGRRSGELRLRETTRQNTGSPFIEQVEDDEVEEPGNDRDLGSSSTPQSYERSRTRFDTAGQGGSVNPNMRLTGSAGSASPTTPHAALAQPSPIRGRGSGKATRSTTTSTSLSTFRSNSASPPPDLLESGSISSDLESLELGNNNRRPGRRARLADSSVQRPLLPAPVTAPQTGQIPGLSDEVVDAGPSRNHGRTDDTDLTSLSRKANDQGDRTDARDNINGSPLPPERKKKHRRKRHDREGNRSRLSSRSGGQADSRSDDTGWIKDAGRNLSERERTLWIWVNVVDLDGYLQEVR